jgi:hypothetical protein
MKVARYLAFVAVITSLMTGCGTVCNLASSNPQVYGGLDKDAELTREIQGRAIAPPVKLAVAVFVLPDFLASLAGDTLTLPLMLYLADRNVEANADGGKAVPDPKRPAQELVQKPEG